MFIYCWKQKNTKLKEENSLLRVIVVVGWKEGGILHRKCWGGWESSSGGGSGKIGRRIINGLLLTSGKIRRRIINGLLLTSWWAENGIIMFFYRTKKRSIGITLIIIVLIIGIIVIVILLLTQTSEETVDNNNQSNNQENEVHEIDYIWLCP